MEEIERAKVHMQHASEQSPNILQTERKVKKYRARKTKNTINHNAHHLTNCNDQQNKNCTM
jgi:hypothetical protein